MAPSWGVLRWVCTSSLKAIKSTNINPKGRRQMVIRVHFIQSVCLYHIQSLPKATHFIVPHPRELPKRIVLQGIFDVTLGRSKVPIPYVVESAAQADCHSEIIRGLEVRYLVARAWPWRYLVRLQRYNPNLGRLAASTGTCRCTYYARPTCTSLPNLTI